MLQLFTFEQAYEEKMAETADPDKKYMYNKVVTTVKRTLREFESIPESDTLNLMQVVEYFRF